MSKIPRITGVEAVRAFGKVGFREDRQRGSHCVLKKGGHRYVLSIPLHGGKTSGVGLLKSLITAAGLNVDEFVALL